MLASATRTWYDALDIATNPTVSESRNLMLEITVRIRIEDSVTGRTVETEEIQPAVHPEAVRRLATAAANAAELGFKAPRHDPAVNG